jgi:chromosome segregation ATPase
LSGQLRSSKERTQQLEGLLKVEKARNAEIQEMLSKAEQRIKNYDLEKQVELEVMQKQVEDMSQHLKDKTEKARVIETKLRLMSEEVNKVKDRVRVDIRRIRVREKELEGQLEILKKDSGALLQARDEKILELKRRIDLLEFNMELVQEQYEKERRASDELKLKLKDAAQAMKQANGFLEQ